MEWFTIILILLVAIAISNVINHFIPMIPVPLIQIALGSIFAVIPLGIHIVVQPELFFVLFVAPILFNDGKMIPKRDLWKLKVPILLLALGLVFATVIIGGYLIHWLIKEIPLPAAFALAAILSPTDAVAVSALSKKAHINKTIMTLLEGEALMNDASGLVAFKFAIAATVTGVFSLKSAALSFLYVALVGLVIGALVAFFIIKFRIFLRRLGMEDITLHMLIQILTPFLIYLIAEHFGVSGILAVVAGGLVHSIEKNHVESSTLELQIMSDNTWSVIMFILNGLVFVLLGLQIPDVMRVIYYNQEISNLVALGYVVLLTVALIVIRYIWIYLCWRPAHVLGSGAKKSLPRPKSFLLISISGVRGAVTLAAAFSIPFTLQNGSAFPERDLMIFLAAGVILTSLVIASIFLPLLTSRNATTEATGKLNPEQAARIKLMKAVIRSMQDESNVENREAAMSVISDCHRVVRQITNRQDGVKWDFRGEPSETEIWLTALNAEEREVENMLRQGKITRGMYYRLLESLNHREMLLTNKYKYRFLVFIHLLKRILAAFKFRKAKADKLNRQDMDFICEIKTRMSKAAVEAVKEQMNEKNTEISLPILSHYREAIERFGSGLRNVRISRRSVNNKKELQFKAIQIQRNEVQILFEKGEISRETANKLRRFINYTEASMLQEDEMVEM